MTIISTQNDNSVTNFLSSIKNDRRLSDGFEILRLEDVDQDVLK